MSDSNNQHPITPPPELVKEWVRDANHNEPMFEQVARTGAVWGADKELEEICSWLELHYPHVYTSRLRRCRRPKPPSLKEQALTVLDDASDRLDAAHENIIRRALESLPS